MLFKALTRIKADFPQKPFVFMGDANAHNPVWIPSVSPLDEAGIVAEEFAVVHGLKQLVNFPTRGGNTLDLMFSDLPGKAIPEKGLDTSDHISATFSIQVTKAVPPPPRRASVRN